MQGVTYGEIPEAAPSLVGNTHGVTMHALLARARSSEVREGKGVALFAIFASSRP